MKIYQILWNDENGFVVSSELILIATILVIAMVVGLQTVRDAVLQELGDVANAIGNVICSMCKSHCACSEDHHYAKDLFNLSKLIMNALCFFHFKSIDHKTDNYCYYNSENYCNKKTLSDTKSNI